MKHSVKITLVLLAMFLVAQFIGLWVVHLYAPEVKEIDGKNVTSYHLPYGMEPPQDINPKSTLVSVIIAIVIAILAMFFLMKFGATFFLRAWFFIVIVLALGITVNALFFRYPYASIIALIIALPLAYLKVFKRNIIVHNFTELLIYPGIAAIFVPLFNIWTICLLLVIISIYDMYAVWHSGIMQKMAKYQIKTLRVFSGFFIPYLGNKDRKLVQQARNSSRANKLKSKKFKVSVAILGGGDIVFPMILAGVVLRTLGLIPAIIIALGATLALAFLFYISEKGKFYPAMPFISLGCFIALGIAYLV